MAKIQARRKEEKRNIVVVFIIVIVVMLCIIAYCILMNHRISSEKDKANIANIQLFSANKRINNQRNELQKANDSITKQKTDLQVAFEKLSKTELELLKSNADLVESNNKLQKEKLNVLMANKKLLLQRSIEYGNLAYNYIEDGKISEAEYLLHKIIPDDDEQYVYTQQMERAIRRYYNYKDRAGVKLIENRELLGSYIYDFPYNLRKYGFLQPRSKCEEVELPSGITATAVFNQEEDTLLVINDEFENTILINDGNVLCGYKNDSIYIWDIRTKRCLCKRYMYDGILCVKVLNNNRICVLGREYFTIYKYDALTLNIESKTKILNRPKIWKNKYGNYGNIPFLCDDKDKRLIYQREDSCLIVQQIGTDNIILDRKIDGVIESIALSQKDIPYIAIVYKNKECNPYRYDHNRLNVLHYPSLIYLYERNFDGYIIKLEFSSSNYLGALVRPSKVGITQLYLWDMSNLINVGKSEYFNISRTVTINNVCRYGDIKFITDDGCVVYLKTSKQTNISTLYFCDLKSNKTDVLLESKNANTIEAKSSLDGSYIVYSKREDGVWLYDRKLREKKKISSNDFLNFRNISISSDGSKVAFRALNSTGKSIIVVYDVNNKRIKQYSLRNGFGIALNGNGSRILLEDENTILYDYNLNTLKSEKISMPVGSSLINKFGYSKNGEYVYQIYSKNSEIEGYKTEYYIKMWSSITHELIMENVIDYSDRLFIDSDNEYIYKVSSTKTEIIPFKKIETLIQLFRNS